MLTNRDGVIRALLLIGLAVLGVVALPVVGWWLQPERPLALVAVDKTVPTETRREHVGFYWLLRHHRYTEPTTGDLHHPAEGYYGFYPLPDERYRIRALPRDLGEPDLIYLLDTYGVYEAEFYGSNPEGRRSPKIYGGLTLGEVRAVRAAHRRGVPVLAEFNTFGSPSDRQAADSLTALLGLDWTGWTGRYVEDLAPGGEVPVWFIENHQRATDAPWDYSGPGMIFVHTDGRQVLLEWGIHFDEHGVMFTPTGAAEARYGVRNLTRYRYWFDITDAHASTEVLGRFRLPVTVAGEELLDEAGVLLQFPALTRGGTPETPAFYLAGDAADFYPSPRLMRFRGLARLKSLAPSGETDPLAFFWRVYVPFVETVLSEVTTD